MPDSLEFYQLRIVDGVSMSLLNTFIRPASLSVSDDPCLTLRELSEFGTRDEPFLRRLAIEATSFLDHDKNIERVREVIVDLVLKIEIETILGGPAGELRARLHKILDVIVAKRGY